MIKAVVVVSSPLQLINSFEFLYSESIGFDETAVFFSGKSDNVEKLNQAKKLLELYQPKAVVYHMRHRPSYKITSRNKILRATSKIVRYLEIEANEFTFKKLLRKYCYGLSPDYLIGFGAHLCLSKKIFPSAEVWHVDGGSSSLRGQLSKFDTGKEKFFSIYSSQEVKIESGRFRKNKNKMRLGKIDMLPVSDNLAVFISANTRGLSTHDKWYSDSLLKAKELHHGEMIYFRRSNEPVSCADALCQKYDMKMVDINFPVEDFLYVELGLLPKNIFSVASSALWFMGQLSADAAINVNYLMPSSHPTKKEIFSSDMDSYKSFSDKGKAGIKFIRC